MFEVSYKELLIETFKEFNKRKWAIIIFAFIFVIFPCWLLEIFFKTYIPDIVFWNFISIRIVVFIVLAIILYDILEIFILYMLRPKEELNKLNFFTIIKDGFRYFWSSMLFLLIKIFILLPSYLFLIFPGLIATLRWIFVKHILIMNDQGLVDSIAESMKMTKGKTMRAFKYASKTVLLVFVVGVILILAAMQIQSYAVYYKLLNYFLGPIYFIIKVYFLFGFLFITIFVKRMFITCQMMITDN